MINYTYIKKDNYLESLDELIKIVSMLRSPNGCPWDRKLKPEDAILSLIEESYEYLETDDKSDEIGDILINVFMLMTIHHDLSDFELNESIHKACNKLYTRHVHVFGNVKVKNSDEAIKTWEKVKKEERKNDSKNNFFANIPAMHPMDKSFKIQKRLAKVGFDFPTENAIFEKIQEEIFEVKNAMSDEEKEEELGDLLTSVIELCRFNKISPTKALFKANNKVIKRFNKVVSQANKDNLEINKENNTKLNEYWDNIKV